MFYFIEIRVVMNYYQKEKNNKKVTEDKLYFLDDSD